MPPAAPSATPAPQTPSQPQKHWQIYAGLLVLLFLFCLITIVFVFKKYEAPQTIPVQTTAATSTTTGAGGLTIVYRTIASTTETSSRGWQTDNVWVKVGSGLPELAGTVGKVGEEPVEFVVSPNRKYLFVNLEKSIDLINLITKEKRRIFTSQAGIVGAAFSQDSSSLLVSVGTNYFDIPGQPDALYRVDITTGAITTIAGPIQDSAGDIHPVVFRNDGAVLYYPITYKDCGSNMRVILPNMQTATGTYMKFGISPDGDYALGKEDEIIPNPLDDGMCASGGGPDIVSVLDPITGQVYGKVGRAGEFFDFVAFSPDHSQVLFGTTPANDPYGTEEYYLGTVSAVPTSTPVADPNALLASWHAVNPLVGYDREYNIVSANEILVSKTDGDLNLITAFYQ